MDKAVGNAILERLSNQRETLVEKARSSEIRATQDEEKEPERPYTFTSDRFERLYKCFQVLILLLFVLVAIVVTAYSDNGLPEALANVVRFFTLNI